MFTYKMSRREIALVAILLILIVGLAWFIFVYQSTTDMATRLDGQLSEVQAEITVDSKRVSQMKEMEDVIAQRKAAGAVPTTVPAYDNIRSLMTELNGIMSAASTYEIKFEDIDFDSGEYVQRKARIDYGCDSFSQAEQVVEALASGRYPCRIDSVSITDTATRQSRANSTGQAVSASVYVTFLEDDSKK